MTTVSTVTTLAGTSHLSSFFFSFTTRERHPAKVVTVDRRNATVTLTGNDDREVCDGLCDEDVTDRHEVVTR
ncbi:MAG TPA: hypothetical protein VJW23_04100, partial [Propionibacteriaceae bacterium]|nr:hypothetical protein [Propionibacteriaceae bacterium]